LQPPSEGILNPEKEYEDSSECFLIRIYNVVFYDMYRKKRLR